MSDKETQKEYLRKWRTNNKDKVHEQNQRYYNRKKHGLITPKEKISNLEYVIRLIKEMN
jgi:hypothetical protein